MTSKLLPLDEAVRRLVQPHAHLHLAYGGGRPNAAIAEIVRQFAGTRPGFRISAQGFVNTQHALLAADLVDRLTVAYAGENYPSPRPNRVLQRALRAGTVQIDHWSIWTLTARLMAGALGVPFLPVRSLAGSSMADDNRDAGYTEVTVGAERVPAVTALRPDLVLVQALAADRLGNVILAPPYGEGAWGALAARHGVLACVESIVDEEFVRAHNSLPMIPAHAVRAVCHVPLGSHPYGISNGGLTAVPDHREDAEFMAGFRSASRDPDATSAWLAEWLLKTRDDYLDRLGPERLAVLRGPAPKPATPPVGPPTATERMTVTLARVVAERVRAAGHDLVLSGIGYAHLAAWSAVGALRADGVPVELAAELGMSGFVPAPGDPYLFASGNFPSCRQLTDVLSVLGRDISGPGGSSLGVLGAGQVDRAGNLNSTYGAHGEFIVGSGGANDVASGADEVVVVVQHTPDRLVDAVPYVTAPGRNVSVVVTSAAVLERRDGRFVVTRHLDADPAALAGSVGFPLELASDCRPEPPPTAAELRSLRAFDPERLFLS